MRSKIKIEIIVIYKDDILNIANNIKSGGKTFQTVVSKKRGKTRIADKLQ